MDKNPVTVAIKNSLKKYDHFYLHVERNPNAPSYSDECDFHLTAKHFSVSHPDTSKLNVTAKGSVSNGSTDEIETYEYNGATHEKYSGVFRPSRGYWSLLGGEDYFRAALKSVPDDAELHFRVCLDAATSEVLTKARLHGDTLKLIAIWKRGTKEYRREFLLDVWVGHHNSARFGVYL